MSSTPEIVPISVSSRILRHISRGIYRTPAGALKELLSNSYDAGALEVTVNTGWPAFSELTITDNGSGMSRVEFTELVRQIGLSSKVAGRSFRLKDGGPERRVIGHYGIGLLAVGQLAARMEIRSKESGSTSGFRAELDFDQFEGVADPASARVRVSDEADLEEADSVDRDSAPKVLPIGKCSVWTESYDKKSKSSSFTKIVLTRLREEVVNKLSGTYRDKQNEQAYLSQRYSPGFDQLLQLLREKEPLVKQGVYPYERLLWELGVYCPIRYPDAKPFRKKGVLEHFGEEALKRSFALLVDGMELTKPIEKNFFDDEFAAFMEVFTWRDEPYTKEKDGPRASLYLVFKPRIRPKALQGILVREAGVAVGLYDTTYLEYPNNEGYKFNQLTGEIHAQGLSGALNVDRNSFNETDDRYLALCDWLHTKLRRKVFPAIKQLQKGPLARRRKENQEALERTLVALGKVLQKPKRVTFRALGKGAPLVRATAGGLAINTDHPDGKGSGAKKEKVLLAAALVLGELVDPSELEKLDLALAEAKKRSRSR